MQNGTSITFIGSGNMATNLALIFFEKGINIDAIYSRNIENARLLAKEVNALAINDLKQIPKNSSLYFLAVNDDSLSEVLELLPNDLNHVIHCSGSINTELLHGLSKSYGCFYPLQTVNKNHPTNFLKVPLFIEANNQDLKVILQNLGNKISKEVHYMESERRKKIHIAAIGVNNFTHYILAKSKEYCEANEIDFDLLLPLLKKTIDQLNKSENSVNLQTGPARRGDVDVIKEHIKTLADFPAYQTVYRSMSQLILNEFHGKDQQL